MKLKSNRLAPVHGITFYHVFMDSIHKVFKLDFFIGSTSNQQTAVLLRNMLDRIDQLENDLRTVVQNSSLSFISMNNVIKKLNDTILKELNRTGKLRTKNF